MLITGTTALSIQAQRDLAAALRDLAIRASNRDDVAAMVEFDHEAGVIEQTLAFAARREALGLPALAEVNP